MCAVAKVASLAECRRVQGDQSMRIVTMATIALMLFVSTANARTNHGDFPHYGGSRHTGNHGGSFSGGHSSFHRGGHRSPQTRTHPFKPS